jgi:hypothetical protein
MDDGIDKEAQVPSCLREVRQNALLFPRHPPWDEKSGRHGGNCRKHAVLEEKV